MNAQAQGLETIIAVSALTGLLLTSWAFAADKQDKAVATPPDNAGVEPGKVVAMEDSQSGQWKYWVPKDYTPDRFWPIIYCYHGMGQTARVWPFSKLTDHRGFIVVGMEYVNHSRYASQRTDYELANLKRIHNLLARRLRIDDRRQFIGGFSMGGWWTSLIAEKEPSFFAGIILLGSGRAGSRNVPQMTGEPIFIGVGEKDPSRQGAEVAAKFYRSRGAGVTLEIFKGMGHNVDTENVALKTWLKDHRS
ncbi:MAG TPA: dienelactone hydrolase family protein [Verrucomicrobiae bacterium]|nr:dienelactone hydrolase family protein [Verrucomicrobiae bacterium]